MRKMTKRLTALAAAAFMLFAAGAFPAAAAADYPVIKSGSKGADALATQHLLNYRGYPVLEDGIAGSKTVSAIKAFQSANGLTPDGIAGKKTFEALIGTAKSGDKNSAVFAVQHLLRVKFGASVTENGTFDAATVSAVKAFQTFTGLKSDGIVGAATWQYLFGCSGFTIGSVVKTATKADTAIAKAKTLLGSTAYNGYCQRFVRISYEAAGITGYASTAIEAWKQWGVSASATNVPKGATVYFETSSGNGHAGIYMGDGNVIHAVQTVRIETLSALRAKYRYLGWGWQGGVNPN